MSLTLDRHLFTQVGLDSGSLTMLGSIVHSFGEPGQYRGALHRGDKVLSTFTIVSDKASPAAQVTLDLADLAGELPAAPGDEGDCCCEPAATAEGAHRFVVNPRGYVLFRVSGGAGGYWVSVRNIAANEKDRGYDSRALAEGDIFSAVVLRPGAYEVVNELAGARGELRVAYPTVGKEAYRPPDPAHIQCGKGSFEPAAVELKPAQGALFHAEVPTRMSIRLVEPDDGPGDRPTRASRPGWRNRSAL